MRRKRAFWYGVLGASLAGCAVCAALILGHYISGRQAGKVYEEIRNRVKETVSLLQPVKVMAMEPDNEYLSVKIDFEELQKMNPDIYAWITLPGTEIDYPVLQDPSEDGDFYLNHDAQKNESTAGSIYSESCNKKDFTDFHTVLYGHDMKDNSMFGSLLLFEERSIMERNKTIYIYLPDQILEYEIFAAYVSDSEHLLEGFDQEERLDRLAYLAEVEYECREENVFDQELFHSVTEKSRILTLSTCYHGDHSKRFLVQAVLSGVKEDL